MILELARFSMLLWFRFVTESFFPFVERLMLILPQPIFTQTMGGKNLYWMRTMVWKRRFDSATCTVFSIHCLSEIHTVIFAAMKFNRFTSELLSLEWETFRRSINIKLKYDFEKSEIFQYIFCYNFKLDKQKLSHKHCDISFCWTSKSTISNEFLCFATWSNFFFVHRWINIHF